MIRIQLNFFTIFLNFKFSTNGDFYLESDYHWFKSVSESSHPQHTAVNRTELTSGLICCSYCPFFLRKPSFLSFCIDSLFHIFLGEWQTTVFEFSWTENITEKSSNQFLKLGTWFPNIYAIVWNFVYWEAKQNNNN